MTFKKVLNTKSEANNKPQVQQVPAELVKQSQSIVSQATSLKITNDGSYNDAVSMLTAVAQIKKSLEEKRKFFVEPLNKHVTSINTMFKEYSAPLTNADTALRSKIADFRAKEQAKQQEKPQDPVIASAIVKTTHSVTGGRVTGTKRWTYEIDNENKVPREFCSPDPKKIKGAMDMGMREITGVRIFEIEDLKVYTK